MKNILIVAAHPDDEVLGCGGTIAKLTSDGIRVNVLFLADGESSRKNIKNLQKKIIERKENAKKALKILGCNSVKFLNFPDNRLDTVDLLSVIKKIEDYIEVIQPYAVFTHFEKDLNIDHQVAHRAVITACRPQPNYCVKELFFFEVASSTEWNLSKVFMPNFFVDITKTLSLKKKALRVYEKELRNFPHPRSIKLIEAQAHLRGSSVGCKAAEAFIIGRKIYGQNN